MEDIIPAFKIHSPVGSTDVHTARHQGEQNKGYHCRRKEYTGFRFGVCFVREWRQMMDPDPKEGVMT